MAREKAHKALSYRFLLMVLAALFALTAVTVWVSTINLHALNVWLALAIATTKASLVLLFFMHLKYENMVLKVSFLATIGFLATIIGFIFLDVAFR